VMWC